MKFTLNAAFFVMLVIFSGTVFAQAPRTIKDIPLFPGSRVDEALMENELRLFEETTAEMAGLLNKGIQVMVTTATPEEVCRWYIARLKAKEDMGEGNDPDRVVSGGTSPVLYELDYYEADAFEDQFERDLLIRDGAWVERSLRDRPKSANGKNLLGARFIWEFKNEDDGRSEICLVIDDASFDFEKKTSQPKTSIAMTLLEFPEDGSDVD